jgi:hypothetical protein
MPDQPPQSHDADQPAAKPIGFGGNRDIRMSPFPTLSHPAVRLLLTSSTGQSMKLSERSGPPWSMGVGG